jgi:GNAT superfamily N-acetyltransferase
MIVTLILGFTDPKYRGKGEFKIIEALKNWCSSLEIRPLDVYNDNPAAIKAYEKVGFKST